MLIDAIDHINIITDDLDQTVDFYERVLGLRRGEYPGAAMGWSGAWMFDLSNNPAVQLTVKPPESDFGAGHVPGAVTGAVHHLAFRCRDFEAARKRLNEIGIEYQIVDVARFGARIFLHDPNNILLELTFPDVRKPSVSFEAGELRSSLDTREC